MTITSTESSPLVMTLNDTDFQNITPHASGFETVTEE